MLLRDTACKSRLITFINNTVSKYLLNMQQTLPPFPPGVPWCALHRHQASHQANPERTLLLFWWMVPLENQSTQTDLKCSALLSLFPARKLIYYTGVIITNIDWEHHPFSYLKIFAIMIYLCKLFITDSFSCTWLRHSAVPLPIPGTLTSSTWSVRSTKHFTQN